ncbi:Hypothetical predicted protein [Cloeon dipterum]|uniref:C2H2-type domain-containing protein n=1 Tax=Cloeon dipterum TaxID=197152 RepID=A0A8S1DM09_9INSE|nr:Hypothetical predicted protein [Cloeon dipterum]
MDHAFLCVACNVPFLSSRDRGIHKCFSSFQEDYSRNVKGQKGQRTARSKLLTCEQCKKTYSSHANFLRHVAEPHTHHCKVCNIYFATQRQRLGHGCRPAPQPEGTLPDAPTKFKYQCSKCAKGFVQETNYQEHIAKAHDSFCKTCERYFISARDRISHSCLYKCRHCDFSAKTHTKLQVHIENFHENGIEFECDICKEKFLSKRSLISHIVASGIDHRFIGTYCRICNYDYRTMYSLKLHIQRVHQGVFKCTGCNTSFATKEERKAHYRANHSQKKQEVQCPECPKIISNVHNLQIHINMVHRKLRPHLCQVCGKSYPCKSSLQFHMTMHTGEKKHVCNVCGHAFARIENLKQHMRIHNNVKPFLCDFCPQKFRQAGSLKIHRRIHTGETPYHCHLLTWPWKGVKLPCGRRKKKPEQPKPQSVDDLMKIEVVDVRSLPDFSAEPALPPENVTIEEFNNPITARADFTCSQCHLKFKNYGSYTSHSKKPHTYHCKWCNKNFVNARGEHACAFKCTKCDFRYFKTNGALRSHNRWFHTGDEFLCHDCGAKCPTKLAMRIHYKKIHIKKQSEDERYKTWCSECQRSFSSAFSLMKHKQRMHEGKILCSVCPEAFASKEERRAHVKLVHPSTREKQLFDCPECGKKLSSKAMMQVHVDNIHKKLKPHLCQVCGKAFGVVSHLKLHMMMHTGEKKHVCKVCGHAFARIENLTQHKRIHEDLKPFLCDFCPMKFRQQSSLKSHRRIHTGETPYKCQLCPASFRSKQQLDNHVKFHPS